MCFQFIVFCFLVLYCLLPREQKRMTVVRFLVPFCMGACLTISVFQSVNITQDSVVLARNRTADAPRPQASLGGANLRFQSVALERRQEQETKLGKKQPLASSNVDELARKALEYRIYDKLPDWEREEFEHRDTSHEGFTWRNQQIYKARSVTPTEKKLPLPPLITHNFEPSPLTKPRVVILSSTRSHQTDKTVATTKLFTKLLKSLGSTVTREERAAFDVQIWIAVDDTDKFWNAHLSEITKSVGEMPLSFAVYRDAGHRIPFNEIAVLDVADYYVRVNDDSEFKTAGWISAAIRRLQQFDPPNLGVVGPKCLEGNAAILTHDFVHQTHLQIFDFHYYPSVFANWYLDDWITRVYSPSVIGVQRMEVLQNWKVKHWMSATRYRPNQLDAQYLPGQLELGRRRIAEFVQRVSPDRKLIADQLPTAVPKATQDVIKQYVRDTDNFLVWGISVQKSQFFYQSTLNRTLFLAEDTPTRKIGKFQQILAVHLQNPFLAIAQLTFNQGTEEQRLVKAKEYCLLQTPTRTNLKFEWDVVWMEEPREPKSGNPMNFGLYQVLYTTYQALSGKSKPTTLILNGPATDFAISLFGEPARKHGALTIFKVQPYVADPVCDRRPVRALHQYHPDNYLYSLPQMRRLLQAINWERSNILIFGRQTLSRAFTFSSMYGRKVVILDSDPKAHWFPEEEEDEKRELYRVNYSSDQSEATYKDAQANPETYVLEGLPSNLTSTSWDVVIIDSPENDSPAGRIQSICSAKKFLEKSKSTTIFLDDSNNRNNAALLEGIFSAEAEKVTKRAENGKIVTMSAYIVSNSPATAAMR